MTQWILLILNGLSFAMLLFLVASGLTLTLGVMRLVNLTHGSFYLVAVYVGYGVTRAYGSMVIGWVAGTMAAAALGLTTYWLLNRAMGNDLREALLTFGLVFVIADLVLARWGGASIVVPTPRFLAFTLHLGPVNYPAYRLFIVAVGLAIAALMRTIAYRTSVGTKLRAVIDDQMMAESIGLNSHRLMMLTFVVGAALAGLAGVLGGPILGGFPGADIEILLFALVVVILGGVGSVSGSLLGSVIVGVVNSLTSVFLPELALFAIFATMVLVLAMRPGGLGGR